MANATFHLDLKKVNLALARNCLNKSDLPEVSGVPYTTIANVFAGKGTTTKTAGKIARALGVDVTEIIKDQE